VFSEVSLDDLDNPELLYRKLGAKLVVGMPFKVSQGHWAVVCGRWSRTLASRGFPWVRRGGVLVR